MKLITLKVRLLCEDMFALLFFVTLLPFTPRLVNPFDYTILANFLQKLNQITLNEAHSSKIYHIKTVNNQVCCSNSPFLLSLFYILQLWTCSKRSSIFIWDIVENINETKIIPVASFRLDPSPRVPFPTVRAIFPIIDGGCFTMTIDGLQLWDNKVFFIIVKIFFFVV